MPEFEPGPTTQATAGYSYHWTICAAYQKLMFGWPILRHCANGINALLNINWPNTGHMLLRASASSCHPAKPHFILLLLSHPGLGYLFFLSHFVRTQNNFSFRILSIERTQQVSTVQLTKQTNTDRPATIKNCNLLIRMVNFMHFMASDGATFTTHMIYFCINLFLVSICIGM